MLTRIVLDNHVGLRESIDDLSNYFYYLREHHSNFARCAMGRSLRGEDYGQWGGVRGRKYRLVLSV